MAQTGFPIAVGSQSPASLPSLCSVTGSGRRPKTHLDLPLARVHFSLGRRRFKLQLSSSVFCRKVSKCRVHFAPIGCSVVAPRSKLEELSTAEELSEKRFSKDSTEEAIWGREDNQELSSASAADKANDSFDWLAQWYPVGVLKHMDKRQPHPLTVLGRDLVLWWDRSGGQWQVFADTCPHRMAPLSEGRINEQGQLQCSYHGWSFAPSGACTSIPQAPKDVFEKRNSKRSCAVVYHSTEQQGLLWVYMDTSVDARGLAGNSPPSMPTLSDPDFVYDLVMSDVTYSYEALIENLLDPAHVPFAHHGIQGRRELGKPLDFRVETVLNTGFRGGRGDNEVHRFIAPCLSMMDLKLPPPKPPKGHPWALKLRELIMSKASGGEASSRQISGIFLCVPLTPEKSRVFFAFPRNFAKPVHNLIPKWWNHLVHMAILDSDMMLLHLMERRLDERGGMANIENLYYCPTASDAFVLSYRKWLKQFAGSVPDFGPKATNRLPPSAPRTTVLDRHTLHVTGCTYCSGAARNLNILESVLQALPLVLVGLVAASNTRPLRGVNGFSVPLLCAAFLSYLASKWLQKWIKKYFVFHDYNHALVK